MDPPPPMHIIIAFPFQPFCKQQSHATLVEGNSSLRTPRARGSARPAVVARRRLSARACSTSSSRLAYYNYTQTRFPAVTDHPSLALRPNLDFYFTRFPGGLAFACLREHALIAPADRTVVARVNFSNRRADDDSGNGSIILHFQTTTSGSLLPCLSSLSYTVYLY
jgi:hypothetical protein